MAFKVTFSGIDRTDFVDQSSSPIAILKQNEISQASLTMLPGFVPTQYESIIIYDVDGVTPVYGGIVMQCNTEAYEQGSSLHRTHVQCNDAMAFTQWCFWAKSYIVEPPAGQVYFDPPTVTLKQVLQDLIADKLTIYGITLDPAQDVGDSLATFNVGSEGLGQKVSEFLRELAASCAPPRVVQMSPLKALRLIVPGTNPAPFNITEANPHCLNFEWEDSTFVTATKVILVCGPTGTGSATQNWIVGVPDSWEVDIQTKIGGTTAGGIWENYGTSGQVFRTCSPPGQGGYYFFYEDVGRGAVGLGLGAKPDAGTVLTFVYTAVYPFVVTSEMVPFDTPAGPVVEIQSSAPKQLLLAPAQALADGMLAAQAQAPRTAHVRTLDRGFLPNQSLSVTLASRETVSENFTITEVQAEFTEFFNTGQRMWIYTLTLTATTVYQGSYLSQMRELLGGGSSGSTSAILSTGGVVGGNAGTGTIGVLAKWITASTLGNSLLSEDGTIVTAAGTMVASVFSGNASGLTNIPAEQLVGNIPWATLPLASGTWTGSPTITGALTLNDQLKISGIITTPTGVDLRFAPTSSVILNPASKLVLPQQAYDINLGSLGNKYLTLHAAELWVETLVAQNTIATIGGRIIVGPTNSLVTDVAVSDTSIVMKYGSGFAVNDIIYFEADGKVEFMRITGAPASSAPNWFGSGTTSLLFAPASSTAGVGWQYTVTRNLDGSGANVWYAGDALLNTGQTGSGFIDIYSVRGVKSSTEAGPTIVGNVRLSTTYNDWAPRWAIGNLKGLYSYGSDTYGVALGDPAVANCVIDATNGIRFRIGTTVYSQLTGTTFTIGLPGGNRMVWDNTNLVVVSSTVSIDSGGVSIAAPSTSYATAYSYKFTPNATIGGTSWGVFAKNADSLNRYLGIQNVTTTNGKNTWIEFIATGRTTAPADVTASLSLFSDGAVTGVSSIVLVAGTITLGGTVTATTISVQGSSGLQVSYALTVGAGASVDPLLVQVNGVNKCRFDSNGDLRPETDNTQHVGVPSKRFAYMTALSFNTTDVGLENGWSLTESYRIGVTEPGVGLVDDGGQLVAFFGKNQTYLKPLASVDDLPFAVTTLDERIHMDPTPELRVKDYDKKGEPIYKTRDDVVPFPEPTDIQATSRRTP